MISIGQRERKMMENDRHLARVQSRGGKAALAAMLQAGNERGYHLRCSDRSFVPHIQFRHHVTEKPYPYSFALNPEVPTFYVRCPSVEQRQYLLSKYNGAHRRGREVKIPVPDAAVAERIIADLF